MPNPVIISSKQADNTNRLNLSEDPSQKVFKMETVNCKRVKRKSLLKTRSRFILRERTTNRLVDNMSLLGLLKATGRKPIFFASYMLVFMLAAALSGYEASSSSSSLSSSSKSNSIAIGQLLNVGQAQQQQISNFDATLYKNIQEAIRNHPDLREFRTLCEADGVKEIVSMDRLPLTVFAPIDRSLGDLLTKAKSRPINLIELAKHHIAQGFFAPEESTKFPFRFTSYSLLSPLYLNQVQPAGSRSSSSQPGSVFVNNAKILATYMIPIDGEQYQTLHVIDQVIEFAYVSRRTEFRSGATGSTGNQLMMGTSSSGSRKTTTVKKALNLDDLMNDQTSVEGAVEFYARFGDLSANQAQVDLIHARALKGSQQERLDIEPAQFRLDRLAAAIRPHADKLRGKLVRLDESNSLNTYFLPMNNKDLERLLDSPLATDSALPFEALVIPNQVLFTRTMSLGVPHLSLSEQTRVSLSLAKALPDQEAAETLLAHEGSSEELSRKYLATPLMLQAKCENPPAGSASLTSAEILVANIPLSNGVLHLIKKPILVTGTKVLDYLNDHENQLSDLVSAIGSRTGTSSRLQLPAVKVNRFRELLTRERQMLSTFSDPSMNKTILAPSDEAFALLRYDLRALIQGDESMIPKHWDATYRNHQLERMVKRHVVLHQAITSDQIEMGVGARAISDNGKQLNFRQLAGEEYSVECDNMEAHLLHYDLIGTDGVLHIIDRVLVEEQETVHSLLEALVLKFAHSVDQENGNRGLSAANSLQSDLSRLVETNLHRNQELISSSQQTSSNAISNEQMTQLEESRRSNGNELATLSKSIGQYLDELPAANRRLLAGSVNISYQLARLTSLAEGLEDWNDRFKQTERQFTYFVPSDLAWLRLQQQQPELYKPLLYFLDQQQQVKSPAKPADEPEAQPSQSNQSVELLGRSPRSSESSHRLRQILERHLAIKKLSKRDLDQMDSIQTVGATLRLVEPAQQQHLTATFSDGFNQLVDSAALHSISGQQGSYNNGHLSPQSLRLKSIRLGDSASANIVQVNEASNGFVYVIDTVLLQPDDPSYIVQTSSSTAVSSSMSSLLGAHNSAILDFIHNLLAPSPFNMSAQSTLALLGTLLVLITALVLIASLLLIRRRKQSKLNQHRQLESGLTSSSSANSGSTSTTKSL